MDQQERGRREFDRLVGGDPEEVLAGIRRQSPELFDTMMDGFGGPVTHVELSHRDRELATVAMLAALGGAEPQLALHVRVALRHGIAPAELRALCEHVSLYAGYPRALNALAVVDRVLAEAGLPPAPGLRRITLPDHDTVVAHRGDAGPAVMLVHALGLDRWMWGPVLDALSAGRRVFAYDIRGHGDAAGAPPPSTMADLARDLLALADALDLDRVHLVGLALGGAIARSVAADHPDRVASLALLSTVDDPTPDAAGAVPTLTRWFTPEGLAADGWGVRYARERLRRADPADRSAWSARLTRDARGRPAAFDGPTLLLSGERDRSVHAEQMAAFAARVPTAAHRLLPGVPHQLTLEDPAPVTEALNGFLPADR